MTSLIPANDRLTTQAFIGFMSILFQTTSPLRHAFYELFLHFHISLVVMAFVGLWYHIHHHPQHRILLAALILWGLDVCDLSCYTADTKSHIESRKACNYHLAKLWKTTDDGYGRAIDWFSRKGRRRCCPALEIQSRPVHVSVCPVAGPVDITSVLGSLDVTCSWK